MLSEKHSKPDDNISGEPNCFLDTVESERLARFELFQCRPGRFSYALYYLWQTNPFLNQPCGAISWL